MPGFFGKIGPSKANVMFSKNQDSNLIRKSFISGDLYLEQSSVNKFIHDKVFNENEFFLILVEGVILNSLDLIKKYKCSNLFDTVCSMYQLNGNSFLNEFRGSFSGVFYDKNKNKKIIYTNQIGDKQVYYSQTGFDFIFGSEINYLTDFYEENMLKYSLNREAAYYLLTYGFMLEDNTLFDKIKRLLPGHYILIEKNNFEVIQYYKFDNTPDNSHTESEIIDEIDRLFRQAVKREFDKDLEYGYKHLAGLSGGLDSRMTTWVANDMGYADNIVNFTFSQSNYLDATIPRKITGDLRHEWIFKSLDNGLFLSNIESVVKISYGGALYCGLAHSKSCLDLINKDKFGIIHTGQLGDVIISTYYNSLDKDKKFSIKDGANSSLLINKLDINKIKFSYANQEIFKLTNRGFTGINHGLLVAQETNETCSPFLDIDLVEYCLKIPLELRFKHKIYIKWVLKKYPGAARYKWAKLNGKITDNVLMILSRQYLVKKPKKIFNKFLKIFKLKKSRLASKDHMNPFDYWYNTNPGLKLFQDSYYNENIVRLDHDNELKNDCIYMYEHGNSIEKNQVLTLLAVLKLYFNKADLNG